ncbi:DedA family protein [Nakamurella flavida]|uniref:DedA family protein n=1 Tax=Nakamurella flavida TaxID=363630 RepID=A0A939BYY4_9ACTN|nr:DedA family protein [Nakamurella flavida]MBM9475168.1 DedA family protein [Nakamurella flavida]MDP9776741.1 membrane protein DedA with SNARE-associated domain [Nakamurella flavida]
MTVALRLAETSTAELGGVAGWVVGLMETLGVAGAGLAVAAENLFPPLPSEIVLPLAGFTASQGTFHVIPVILVTTLGSLLGALALYWLGRRVGQQRLCALAERIPLMHAGDIDRTVAWFTRHGGKAVFFGRMIPVFRSLISIPAGVERMNVVKFSLLTTAGSLIWNTAFVLAGYLLGQNWAVVEEYAGVLQYVVIGLVAIALTVFVVRRVRHRKEPHGHPVDAPEPAAAAAVDRAG